MSRFVYNIRYVKNKLKASALVDYIATREGVEKLSHETSDRHASEKQQERIADFLQKFPDAQSLIEYEDYTTEPTVHNASALLSAITDNHAEEFFSSDKYIGYISQRPGVEKHGSHGLFSSEENINLERVKKEVSQHKGNIYTTVLSLRREDAARLGYENAAAWKNLIQKNIHKIAENYKIPIDNLKWYAAFHNEGHHPHCHMVMYSDGKQPYLTKKGIENIKSALATDIFQNDLYEIYSEQQRSIETAQSAVKDILSIKHIEEHTLREVSDKLTDLTEKLSGYTGRKVYGYLPKDCKDIVNEIIDRIEAEPTVAEAYSKYQALRDKQLLLYHSADTLPPHVPMRDNVKFKSIKNIIVKEAFKLSGLTESRTPSETSGVNSDDTASDELTTDFSFPDLKERISDDSDIIESGSPDETSGTVSVGTATDELINKFSDVIFSDKYVMKYEWSITYRDCKKIFNSIDATEELKAQAAQQLLQLAIKGNALAAYDVASLLLKDNALPQSEEVAQQAYKHVLKCFTDELPNQKQPEYLMYRIGKMYLHGLGTDVYPEKAASYLIPAAGTGNIYAAYTVGCMFEQGNGVEKSLKNAVSYYTAAAQKGNPYAAYRLAEMYSTGNGVVPKEKSEADRYYYIARTGFLRQLKQSPDDHLYLKLGTMTMQGQGCEADYTLAKEYLTKAYDFGNENAAYMLGRYYSIADNPDYNMQKALEFLHEAAEQENSYASYQLGKLYLFGTDELQIDYTLAKEYLTKAYDLGNENVAYMLGRYYSIADNPDYNMKKAVGYYQSVAESNPYASYQLGRIYTFGADGIEKNAELAKKYLQFAADNGVESANTLLEYKDQTATTAALSLFSSVFKLLNAGAKPTAKKNIPEQISDIKEKIKRGEKISNDTTISY